MARTFCRHWPSDVRLRVYAEGFDPSGDLPVDVEDLDIAAPWLKPWKAERSKEQRGNGGGRYNFRLDAVKFAHKVAAIGAAANEVVDVLIWLDADIVTHSPVTVDWLDGLLPAAADLAWLDRVGKYPECGFLMFRLPAMQPIIGEIIAAYWSGAIFRYPQTHDSYVIQQFVEAGVRRQEIKVASLSGDARDWHHPMVAGPLGSRFDHLKGARKELGKSKPADLRTRRSESYWKWV
jgi:hypothetical protein